MVSVYFFRSPVVSATDFVLVHMCQRDFDELRINPVFIENGARNRAHAVADQGCWGLVLLDGLVGFGVLPQVKHICPLLHHLCSIG